MLAAMPARTVVLSALYGLLVFAGAALIGFVLAPLLATATGWFPIEVEARAAFSLATLSAVPYLVGLCAAAAFMLPWIATLSVPRRIGVYAASALAVWVAAVGATLLFG
jgi:hypothetical protein